MLGVLEELYALCPQETYGHLPENLHTTVRYALSSLHGLLVLFRESDGHQFRDRDTLHLVLPSFQMPINKNPAEAGVCVE